MQQLLFEDPSRACTYQYTRSLCYPMATNCLDQFALISLQALRKARFRSEAAWTVLHYRATMGPTALDTLNPLPDTQIMQSGADYLVRLWPAASWARLPPCARGPVFDMSGLHLASSEHIRDVLLCRHKTISISFLELCWKMLSRTNQISQCSG